MRSSTAPLRGPNWWTPSISDGPLTYSLTMSGRRSKIPASKTCAVRNRATRCAAATSFRKRLRTCGSVLGARSLTAARLPVGLRARNTTPCPPSPRRPSNRYAPTSRGSVSRKGSIPDVADFADVTRPFCPGGRARVAIPFLQLPPAFSPAADRGFGGTDVSPRGLAMAGRGADERRPLAGDGAVLARPVRHARPPDRGLRHGPGGGLSADSIVAHGQASNAGTLCHHPARRRRHHVAPGRARRRIGH